ncbi:hypothetical protein BKA93DRAFT_748265 [Sparassis latifolia]
MALSAMEKIVEAHQCFSQIMTERLRRAAESGGQLTPDSKVFEMANSIKEQSRGGVVMDTLNEMQKKTLSLKDQILTWLRKVLQALTVILQVAAAVANIFALNEIWASGALAIGSFVSSATEKVISEMDNCGMINGDFQQMLRFLCEKIPQDVQRAADSLQVFGACHQVLQLELEIQERELLTVDVNVARQAEEDWKLGIGAFIPQTLLEHVLDPAGDFSLPSPPPPPPLLLPLPHRHYSLSTVAILP